jgi:hypothetical protein
MRYVVAFFRFWYDFVIGDDWRMAVGVAASLVATWILAHGGVTIWWLLPLAAISVLWLSLRHEVRKGTGSG